MLAYALDPGASVIPLVIGALLFSFVASTALTFAVTTRLPLVAGWDNLLPAWIGRLHPRRRSRVHAVWKNPRCPFGVDISHNAPSDRASIPRGALYCSSPRYAAPSIISMCAFEYPRVVASDAGKPTIFDPSGNTSDCFVIPSRRRPTRNRRRNPSAFSKTSPDYRSEGDPTTVSART